MAHNDRVVRRIRLKLLGNGWRAFGGGSIPDDQIIEVPESEAAEFLRDRSSARHVEILGWVEDQDEGAEPPDISN